ncbi:DUF305 domain-containing protein [Streptomyces bullii]|uniref:DUF305 domain-containing protein n=1 Tax=Streptomyces bullii TaxID=349910 RepID=A0ABW0UI55_9ACTN
MTSNTRTGIRSRTRTLTRRAALVAVTATAGLVLAACGGDGQGGSGHGGHGGTTPSAGADATAGSEATASAEATAGAHNAQDVAFAQGMIPHHQQALEMARLAADRAASEQVKDLAVRIEKAQDPEIRTMTGWLKTWGEKVPESMPGMDHSGHSGMPGMMGEEDMAKLQKASGKTFDTMFLTMMVEHHEGAVEMATTQKTEGRNGPAKALAEDIITAQNAEITEMKKLLGKG